jgi:hypothetical protein
MNQESIVDAHRVSAPLMDGKGGKPRMTSLQVHELKSIWERNAQ